MSTYTVKPRIGRSYLIRTVAKTVRWRFAWLWELGKNALVACQKDDHSWDPRRVYANIRVLGNHPLVQDKPVAVVEDRGHGFRQEDWARAYVFGPDHAEGHDRVHGMGTNQTGRAKAFSISPGGYWIISRSTPTGKVQCQLLRPEDINSERGQFDIHDISPTDPCLLEYSGYKGTFTLIVVPMERYEFTEDDVREALRPLMPRRQNQRIKFMVGGKLLEPFPLASKLVIEKGSIKAYLNRAEKVESDPYVWFVDDSTGLRVARAAETPGVAYPLGHDLIKGDIFVKGHQLLRFQGEDRFGLTPDFTGSQDWRAIASSTQLHLARPALNLLGEGETVGSGDSHEAARNITQLFHKMWGKPTGPIVGPPIEFEDDEDDDKEPAGGTGGGGGKKPPGGKEKKPPKPKRFGFSVQIEGKTFTMAPFNEEQTDLYARVSGNTIYYNTRFKPGTLGVRERAELQLFHVLHALAVDGFNNFDPHEAMSKVTTWRLHLDTARRAK